MTTWKPVIVHLPMAGRQTIHGPYAALMALLIDWPERRSAYHRAAELCSAALDNEGMCLLAREAFLNAVIRAGAGGPVNRRVGTKKGESMKLVSGLSAMPR
ncbi:DUF982 domain-containing protein [Pararhizobium sp. DWP3-4]|uniref:DUF982 domain-containing protein n=1 Tax=Pararhizobium sp. DWP3-4 TaxID=2804565 RepID=UPI003CFB5633